MNIGCHFVNRKNSLFATFKISKIGTYSQGEGSFSNARFYTINIKAYVVAN